MGVYTSSKGYTELANGLFQKSLVNSINTGKSKLYDFVEVALSDIKDKGYDIFIASNGDEKYLKAIYNYHGLDKYIKNIYSINILNSGSKSELVRHIIVSENIQPRYIIGDRLSDFKAGMENGIETIGCRFYFSKDEELKQADYVIDSLKDLTNLIK
ncbi:HAD hydrolase-like protein [Salinicoccus carnicancri]|uniref:HAD hydrolase-like protein n=1 Tax=Salinicoccus carnicancri TaxID=558170 RepID=UPI000A0398E6